MRIVENTFFNDQANHVLVEHKLIAWVVEITQGASVMNKIAAEVSTTKENLHPILIIFVWLINGQRLVFVVEVVLAPLKKAHLVNCFL